MPFNHEILTFIIARPARLARKGWSGDGNLQVIWHQRSRRFNNVMPRSTFHVGNAAYSPVHQDSFCKLRFRKYV